MAAFLFLEFEFGSGDLLTTKRHEMKYGGGAPLMNADGTLIY
jgi:hypothetical protein